MAWRFLVDRDPDETHPRLSGTLFGAWHISDILLRPPTAWDFIANYADLDHWQPFFNHWDFVHLPEADYQIGSHPLRDVRSRLAPRWGGGVAGAYGGARAGGAGCSAG